MEVSITTKDTMIIHATGTCECCGKERVLLKRTKYHYRSIQCECHSPNHFDLIDHCHDCEPKTPTTTKITVKINR